MSHARERVEQGSMPLAFIESSDACNDRTRGLSRNSDCGPNGVLWLRSCAIARDVDAVVDQLGFAWRNDSGSQREAHVLCVLEENRGSGPGGRGFEESVERLPGGSPDSIQRVVAPRMDRGDPQGTSHSPSDDAVVRIVRVYQRDVASANKPDKVGPT